MSAVRTPRAPARAAVPPRRGRRRPRAFLRLAVVGLVGGLLVSLLFIPWPRLDVSGPDDGAVLNAAQVADARFEAAAGNPEAFSAAVLTLDGADVTDRMERTDQGIVFAPGELEDGDHELSLTVPRRLAPRPVSHRWRFSVDATPPELSVEPPPAPIIAGESATISGVVGEDAELTVDGEPVQVRDGAFSVDYAEPTTKPVDVVATDAAGNVTEQRVELAVVPSRVAVDEVRAVHVSFYGWASDTLRDPVLAMAERGEINTVQLDLKDESGVVGYDSQVPLAREIGATNAIFDLDEAIAELHDRGISVVGRIVAFRDPVLADHAWKNDRRGLVLQTPDGQPYAGYGGFTNFAHPRVRQYNIDIAKEAAAAGIDGILYDYVRRPDGPLDQLVIPRLDGTPEEAVTEFVARSRRQLRPYGVDHGASVYGIAATRPTEIAQDIPAIAEHVDYVAPMVYPSHWAAGEYGVAEPNGSPYAIVKASLKDFKTAVKGTDARVVPWLQDFSLGRTYGAAEVRAQIKAGQDVGVNEFLMWDPHVTYTAGAYRSRGD